MRNHAKAAVLSLAAAIFLAVGSPAASANNFRLNEDDILASWNPLRITMGDQTISCPVTVHGSFHSRTVDKSPGSLDGFITSAVVNDSACTNGRVTILTEALPWHIQYDSFTGELPEIASVTLRFLDIRILIDPTGALPTCLWGTAAGDPAIFIAELNESGQVTALRADENRTIDLSGPLCEIAGTTRLAGSAPVRVGDTNNPAVVTLV